MNLAFIAKLIFRVVVAGQLRFEFIASSRAKLDPGATPLDFLEAERPWWIERLQFLPLRGIQFGLASTSPPLPDQEAGYYTDYEYDSSCYCDANYGTRSQAGAVRSL